MPHTNRGADEGAEKTSNFYLRVVTEDETHTGRPVALTVEQYESARGALEELYDSSTLSLWVASGAQRYIPTRSIKYVELVQTELPAEA